MNSRRASIRVTTLLTVAVASATFAMLAPAAMGQTPVGRTGEGTRAGDTGLTEVIVTGTRTSRTVGSSPAPIDVLSASALQNTGKTNLLDVLTQALPAYSVPPNSGGNISTFVRTAKLRGLSPDHTLVLVNGKRRHPSAAINAAGSYGAASNSSDLSLIPTSAIERIEVLRDGAAAQYGSDAIAGVINVILKSNDSDGRVTVNGGAYYEGDGQRAQVLAAHGFSIGGGGALHVSADLKYQGASDRSGPDLQRFYFPGDPREGTVDRAHRNPTGDPLTRLASLAVNGRVPFGERLSVYGFGTYAYRNGKAASVFRTPRDRNNVRAIYPDGFTPYLALDEDDFSMTLGAEWEPSTDSHWDLSSTFARDLQQLDITHTLNPTLGTASPTSFHVGNFDSTQWVTNLDFRRTLNSGSRPLAVALGTEHRRETYNITTGEPASYINGGVLVLDGPDIGRMPAIGAVAFPGFRPSDARDVSRDSFAGYIDIENNVTPAWLVAVATRYEHYSDSDDAWSGKFSTRYEFGPVFAIRGTVSNGFHAPSLAQQNFASTTTSIAGDTRLLSVNSSAARALGAEPLEPEKSLNYSVGAVIQPTENLQVTVDAYQTEVKDRILRSSTFTGPGLVAILQAHGLTGAVAARFFSNAADTRTQGLDGVTTYVMRFGDSTIRLNAAINLNQTTITEIAPTPAPLAAVGQTLFDSVNITDLKSSTPHNKLVLGVDYSNSVWGVGVRGVRYGEVTTGGNPQFGVPDTTLDPTWVTDVEVRYDVTRNVRIVVGGDNVFDVYPPQLTLQQAGGFTWLRYLANTPWGYQGGYYYGRITVSF